MYGELGLPVDIEKQNCDLQLRREFIRNTLNALAPQAALLVQLQFHYSEYFLSYLAYCKLPKSSILG